MKGDPEGARRRLHNRDPSETPAVRYDEATPLGPEWISCLKGSYPAS